MPDLPIGSERRHLLALELALRKSAAELAVFLVYDRPQRVDERPGIARAFFAERCVSDRQLEQMIDAFRSVGSYVELFHGERPLLEALANGRLGAMVQRMKIIYNGIEGGVTFDGFRPGRKSLIPAVADAYNLACSNSDAYACAVGRHKFHYFTLLRALGVPTPRAWHYRVGRGWAGDQVPPDGTRVIAKSTYESWSVGVTEDSVFTVGPSCEERVDAIARGIGQSVTVQEFVPGVEVCVPVFGTPDRFITPPVQAILAKAPGDPDAVMTIEDNLMSGGVTHRLLRASPPVLKALRQVALHTFDLLELSAFARIDFRLDAAEQVWVTDVGVSPGVGTSSSAFCSVAELGFDYQSFVRIVVATTLASLGQLPNFPSRTPPRAS